MDRIENRRTWPARLGGTALSAALALSLSFPAPAQAMRALDLGDAAEIAETAPSEAGCRVVLSAATFDYDGLAHAPEVLAVELGDGTEVPPAQLSVSYERIPPLEWMEPEPVGADAVTSAGRYRVVAAGAGEGAWHGTATAEFEIAGGTDMSGATISGIAGATYTGRAIEPRPDAVTLGAGAGEGEEAEEPAVLVPGEDYALAYRSNVDAGTAEVYAVGRGAYTGYAASTFTISPAQVKSASAAKVAAKTYTGKAIKPGVTLTFNGAKLAPGRDYTLSYKNNLHAGKATVTATGAGNFAGTKTVTFPIAQAKIGNAKVATMAARAETGRAVKPAPKVTYNGTVLKAGRDYTLSYKNNVRAGKATVTVKGKGDFKGTRTVKFTIARNIARAKASKMKSGTYTGSAVKAKPSLSYAGKRLKLGRDYTLSYKNNVRAGKATVTVKGKGAYLGSKSLRFTIAKAPASKMSVSRITAQKYTGFAVKPTPTVKYRGRKLVAGRDYTLSYRNNRDSGKATVTVKGKGDFSGAKSASFTVKKPNIVKAMSERWNNGAAWTFSEVDPYTMYVSRAFWAGKAEESEMVTIRTSDKDIVAIGTYTYRTSSGKTYTGTSYCSDAWTLDKSRYVTITMPKELPDVVWEKDGYTGKPRTISVWMSVLALGVRNPDELTNIYGEVATKKFSEQIYRLDQLSTSAKRAHPSYANFQGSRDPVLL